VSGFHECGKHFIDKPWQDIVNANCVLPLDIERHRFERQA